MIQINRVRSVLFAALLGAALTAGGCGSDSPPKKDSGTDAREAGADATGVGGSSGGTGGGTGGGGAAGADAGADVRTDGGGDVAADAGDARTDATEAGTDVRTDGGGDASEGGADGGPTCTNACTLGAHQCATGGVQTCVMSTATGCTVWGTAAACPGTQTCSNGACACPAAPAGCTAAGKFCNAGGQLVTCVADAQGCFTSSATACPTNTACSGTLPGASCTCNNQCAAVGNFCVDANTRGTCANDGNTPACRVITASTDCPGSTTCSGGACVCPAAGNNAGQGCTTLNATRCGGNDILTCVTETASGCNIWQASTHCGTSGLTCNTQGGGTPACQCPANSATNRDVYVDPVDGRDSSAVFPTGIQSPAQCRFQSLTKALSTANLTRVIAVSAAPPVSFAGETLPLAIPNGVTLTTADTSATPANYTLSFDSASASSAVVLGAGSTLRGLTILSSSSAAPAASLVACSAGAATVNTVVLDGNNRVSAGVDVSGMCAPQLTAVTVRRLGASGSAGIAVNSMGMTTITGGNISTAEAGIRISAGAVSASGLTVTQNLFGVVVNAGSFSAGTTAIISNNGAGLVTGLGTTVNLTTVDVSSNGVTSVSGGLIVGGGIVTGSGVTATQNKGVGILVNAGNVSLMNGTFTANTQDGLRVAGGTVTVSGGSASNNTLAGVLATAGTVTLTGVDVGGNHTSGVELMGATATLTGGSVHNNSLQGIVVDSATGVPITIGAAGSTTVVRENTGTGIQIARSPLTGSGAISVTISNVTVAANAMHGIHVVGVSGSTPAAASATMTNNVVNGNGRVGILVEQGLTATTTTIIQGNDIFSNNTGAGTPFTVGGVFFNTPSTLNGFTSNKVHSNGGDEIGFNAPPNPPATAWEIHPPGATVCGAASNSVYCYGAGNVGVRALGAAPPLVNAQFNIWTNKPAAMGQDFSGPVDVSNFCEPIGTTCP